MPELQPTAHSSFFSWSDTIHGELKFLSCKPFLVRDTLPLAQQIPGSTTGSSDREDLYLPACYWDYITNPKKSNSNGFQCHLSHSSKCWSTNHEASFFFWAEEEEHFTCPSARTFNLLTSGSWQRTGGLWMLLSAPVLSANLSLSLQARSSLCRAITLCVMYAALTLTFTHAAADAQLRTLHLHACLLPGGADCWKHTVWRLLWCFLS